MPLDVLPNAVHAFGGPDAIDTFLSGNMLADPGAADITGQANVTAGAGADTHNADGSAPSMHPSFVGGGVNSGVSDAGTFVLAETALDMHCWGVNPVVTAKLMLNGQDRFSEREGSYFDLVQPYQHHTRNPDSGINCYSFALRPEEHQPSGSCNFSRIDNATLQLVLFTTPFPTRTLPRSAYTPPTTMFSV